MVGEYLTYTTYKHSITSRNKSVTFSDYPQKYPDWYAWADQNIFGGVEYNGLGGGNSDMALYATKLAKDVIHACPTPDPTRLSTIVSVGDVKCLNTLFGTYTSTVINTLIDSTNNNLNLQCVGFTKAAAIGAGHPLKISYGDAKNYAGQTEPGYTWYSQNDLKNNGGVKAGDIAIFWHGLNHIATITSFPGNGTSSFDVAEANGGTGTVKVTTGGNYHFDNNFAGVYRLLQ